MSAQADVSLNYDRTAHYIEVIFTNDPPNDEPVLTTCTIYRDGDRGTLHVKGPDINAVRSTVKTYTERWRTGDLDLITEFATPHLPKEH